MLYNLGSMWHFTDVQAQFWRPTRVPANNVGLINIGAVIGSIIGMRYVGIFGYMFSIHTARRNGGMHLPKHRLLVLVFPAILEFVVLLLQDFIVDGRQT